MGVEQQGGGARRKPDPPRRAARVPRRSPRDPELQVSDTIDLKLHVWRQNGAADAGKFEDYTQYANEISTHASFLEFLDVVNERLVQAGKTPIVFDHDCRE